MKHQTLPWFPLLCRKPPEDGVKPSPSSLFSPGTPSGSRDPSCFSSTTSGPQLRNLEHWDTSNSGSGWPRALSITCLAPVWLSKWLGLSQRLGPESRRFSRTRGHCTASCELASEVTAGLLFYWLKPTQIQAEGMLWEECKRIYSHWKPTVHPLAVHYLQTVEGVHLF